jgi:voltage-gated potassium channel
MKPAPLRRKTYHFLDPTDGMTHTEWVFNAVLTALILLTILTTMLASIPQFLAQYGHELRALELLAAVIFLGEYLARLWVVPERRAVRGRAVTWRDYLAYILSPLALIDLVVLVALFSPMSLPLATLRGLRFLKLLGVLKLGRYSDALRLVGQVLRRRSGELLTFGLIVIVLIFMAASLLYQVEAAAGTKGFGSIPEALWWAVVTLTTTGYGDVYPLTSWGRVLAGVLMLLGIGMVALPAGLIASGFSEALAQQQVAPQLEHWRVRYRFGPETLDVPVADETEAQTHVQAWTQAQQTPMPGRIFVQDQQHFNLNAAFAVLPLAPGEG